MTLRSMWDDGVSMIVRGLAFSRGFGQVRAGEIRAGGGTASWGDAAVLRRVVLEKVGALAETKKSRGWLVGLALVALALVVSFVLA